jgi:hypothetical protein
MFLIEIAAGLAQVAGRASRVALLRPPFEAQPGQVAQLDGPCDGVCGYNELVVENSSLIHFLVLIK